MVQSKPFSPFGLLPDSEQNYFVCEDEGRGTCRQAGVAHEDSDAIGIDISDHPCPIRYLPSRVIVDGAEYYPGLVDVVDYPELEPYTVPWADERPILSAPDSRQSVIGLMTTLRVQRLTEEGNFKRDQFWGSHQSRACTHIALVESKPANDGVTWDWEGMKGA
jgi:hypothetical protein